ncbi:MAG: hypothetical protein IJ446_08985 [Oscillospiraceae bacterium]|nr:hypothetical protein [Oscillospiraceae bacterium]
MNSSTKIINAIYYADLLPESPEEIYAENNATTKLEQEFLKKCNIDRHSELGIEILNFAYDYSACYRPIEFKNGFEMGVRLMSEVYAHE